MALPGNPREQYLRTQVETASKEQLVVMLFDGIIRFTETARKAIEAKKIEESHHALMRAQAIVMELICTVDKEKGGDLAKNLMGLHAYAFNCLITCNMKKDVSKIDEVQNIYRKLREGWVGAMESLGIGASKAAAPSGAAVPPKPAGSAPAAKPPVTFTPKPGQFPSKGPGGIIAQSRPLSTPQSAPKPVTLGASKPGLPVMPKPIAPAAPAAPAAPKAAPAPAAQAQAPATPAPAPAPAPAAPAATPAPSAAAISYGMGRTAALLGAYGKVAPASAPAPAAQPVPAAAAAAGAPAPAPAKKPMLNPKQAALLGAYQANSSRTSA